MLDAVHNPAAVPLRQLSNELSQIAVTYRSPVELTVASDKPRVHTPRQIKQIARSISVFGFLIPIIIDEAGHVLFNEGDMGDAAYIIMEGEAEVSVRSPAGPVVVATLGRNAFLGDPWSIHRSVITRLC